MRFRAAPAFVALVFAMASAAACGETLPNAPIDADAAPDSTAGQTDGAPSDAAPTGPAVTTACAFTDGFTRPASEVSAGWSDKRTNRGTVALVDGTFQAATESGGPLEGRTAVLVKTFATPPKSLRCTFDMRIDTPPNVPDNFVDALGVELEATGGATATIRLAVEHTRISVREDRKTDADAKCECPVSQSVFVASATTGQWTNITFVTNFSAVSVDQDGVFIGSHTFPALDVTKATLLFGVTNWSTGATTQSYRNLSCTLGC